MPRPRIGSDLSIADLERILDRRRSKLTGLERERGKLVKQLDALDREIGALGGNGRSKSGRARNASSLTETIVEVLRKANGALKVAEIVSRVEASGYRSSSANFRGIVNQALIKDKRFLKGDTRGSYLLKK